MGQYGLEAQFLLEVSLRGDIRIRKLVTLSGFLALCLSSLSSWNVHHSLRCVAALSGQLDEHEKQLWAQRQAAEAQNHIWDTFYSLWAFIFDFG